LRDAVLARIEAGEVDVAPPVLRAGDALVLDPRALPDAR